MRGGAASRRDAQCPGVREVSAGCAPGAGVGAGPGHPQAAATHAPLARWPTNSPGLQCALASKPARVPKVSRCTWYSGDLERLQKAPPELVFPGPAYVFKALSGVNFGEMKMRTFRILFVEMSVN